ncbi:MAG: hypothetical protein IJ480_12020 [Clostridia bacterium]|nr:hypothetical protein [Clostridia bacterium]
MELLKRILAALLCTAVTLPLFACGSGESAETVPAADTAAAETETEPVYTLPEADWDGYNFHILVHGNSESGWDKNDFHAEELTGELLNDAVFERNAAVEEQYNVDITDEKLSGNIDGNNMGPGYQAISTAVLAGDAAYGAATVGGYDACTLVLNDYLSEMSAMPHIDLRQPWWDQNAVEDMKIAGKTYFTTGAVSTAINDCTIAVFFNQQVATDFGITDLYSSVQEGTWTFDKMVGYAEMVAADTNGDGQTTTEDRFGSITWDDTVMAAVNSTGVKCASLNDKGLLELTLYTESVVDALDRYTDFAFNKTVSYNYQRDSYDIATPVSMFKNGQSLYYLQLLNLAASFRDMEADFGILPYPKYAESQKEYYSTVGSWHSMFFCVPGVMDNADRSGMIIEALAYYSDEIVTPVYYDQVLNYKYMRDEESIAMLDIILSSRVFDLGWFFKVGNYFAEVIYMIYEYTDNFTSRYEKAEQMALTQVEEINAKFLENKN